MNAFLLIELYCHCAIQCIPRLAALVKFKLHHRLHMQRISLSVISAVSVMLRNITASECQFELDFRALMFRSFVPDWASTAPGVPAL